MLGGGVPLSTTKPYSVDIGTGVMPDSGDVGILVGVDVRVAVSRGVGVGECVWVAVTVAVLV